MWWGRIAVGAALVISALALRDDAQITYCNPDAAAAPDLVIVSTLDGRLTAFSAEDGKKAWDLHTEPLLSSNLHHVELTSGGKWVRLVPSLSGALYRLSGEALEPLPLSAEQLLSSSFKYSDELVVAGSRETVWAGVEPRSGRVVYRCASSGCSGGEEAGAPDLLVLKHSAHTVRALDPRTGHEKWNFSVAEHHLTGGESGGCDGDGGGGGTELAVALAIPDGLVAVRRDDTVLWQRQLPAPVADVWRLSAGRLRRVDALLAAAPAATLGAPSPAPPAPPSLYIGVHDQQLYVQEGASYARAASTAAAAPVPWRPRPARAQLAAPATAATAATALQPLSERESGALALLTLYGSVAGAAQSSAMNHGYFLYADESTCDTDSDGPSTPSGLDVARTGPQPEWRDHQETHHHVHVHVYSLWYWWKEVLLIAVSSALLMNLMIWPRFIAPKFRPATPLPLNQEYIVVEHHFGGGDGLALAPPAPAPPADYVSRYASDFTPLRCLGRGGFGVVFECRNNIDHCSYAVKRITLPRRESKRERVLREVRALAKLEHEHIVRYFNAWLEEPPPAWQERRDASWIRDLEGVTVSMTEEPLSHKEPLNTHSAGHTSHSAGHASHSAGHASHSVGPVANDTVLLNLQRPLWESLDAPAGSEHASKRHRSLSCNDSFSIVFSENSRKSADGANDADEDSFIVFAHSEDANHNSTGAGDRRSVDKRLEKVKECESASKSGGSGKKKKGHRRHWSLDLCVRSVSDEAPPADCKMYLYIQMQLCRRDSLHDWLRQHRSFEARRDKVTSLFGQIVSAVEYVHLAGLIHRDLKPSNIFFAPDGRVKVGDFGLVTAMGDSSGEAVDGFDPQTRHTYRVGTHLYMSPEQLRGDPYDYKVDIYSLGLILFELLHPFSTESERVSCLLRLREGHLPPKFRDQLPHEASLLALMLSGSPSERPTPAGVRSRAPLCQHSDPRWHFTLPHQQPC